MGKGARTRARKPLPWRAIPDPQIVADGVYSWDSQARQFVDYGPPGDEHRVEYSDGRPINCFLIRGPGGRLVAIGYHYPQDMGVLERAGNVNIWVNPSVQRAGLGTYLLDWMSRELGGINFTQQRYSVAGARLVNKYLDRRG